MRTKMLVSSCATLVGLLGLYVWMLRSEEKEAQTITKEDVMKTDFDDLASKVETHFDLSVDITEQLVVYPGDPSFKRQSLATRGANSVFGLEHISLCNHAGTHIDFPAHVVKDGKKSHDYTLNDLIMQGVIIEVPAHFKSISRGYVETLFLQNAQCVFFKTRNSTISKHTKIATEYVYIEPEAAQALLEKQVKIVGIDYVSVDKPNSTKLPVHQILLSNGVLIVENLELAGITPGMGKISILPTKIPDMDGLPARVMLTR